MPDEVKLEPCPFCGENGSLNGNERDGFHTGCSQCYCEVGEAFDRDAMPDHMFRTANDAIAAWNTRTPIEAPSCPELAERVARALAKADGKDPDAPAWIRYPGAEAFGLCWRDQYADKARAAIEATRPTAATDDVVKELVEALEEIAKGEGAFNRDPLVHAENTIDNMKQIATDAITKARTGVTLNG